MLLRRHGAKPSKRSLGSAKLPKKVQDAILYGTGDEPVEIVYQDGAGGRTY